MRLPGGLAFKLTATILAGCLVVFAAILWDSHRRTQEILLGKIEQEARSFREVTAERLKTVLSSTEIVPTRLAEFLARNAVDRRALDDLLRDAVAHNAAVYGSTMAFEPYAFDSDLENFSPYWHRKGGTLQRIDLAEPSYGYRAKEWYRTPRDARRPAWSSPYMDVGGGEVLMITYSVPVVRDAHDGPRFLGVVTADISLDWLQELVGTIRIADTGYAFLLNREREVIAGRRLPRGTRLGMVAAVPGGRDFTDAATRMAAGESGLARVTDPAGGSRAWMAFSPLGIAGASIGMIFPEDEVMAEVNGLGRRMALLGSAGAATLALIITFLAGTITRPLRRLARTTKEVAAGRLDAALPAARTHDEIGALTLDFTEMQRSLRLHIEEERRSAAAVERLDSELRIARQIQMGLVPKDLDGAVEALGCDAFGILAPAREVGGDLFDLFRGPGGDTCFLIGDVSDKGIPAALFMAVTHTLLRGAARELQEPAAALGRVNADLVGRSEASMFVTLLYGTLDPRSGDVKVACGGHTPAVVIPRSGPVRLLGVHAGTVVGVVHDIEIPCAQDRLDSGDTLLLYTDGVTEAMDTRGNLFGEQRLLAHLTECRTLDARAIAERTLEVVRDFSRGVPQSDDIAMLAIRRT